MIKAFVLKLWKWYKGHEGVTDAHHSKYTDADVVSAMGDRSVYFSGGNVGIGTSTIADKLVVNGKFNIAPVTGNAALKMVPLGGHGFSFGARAGAVGEFFIYDRINNLVRMCISEDGDVGLGGLTSGGGSTPTAVLDVDSDIIRLRTTKTPASAAASGNQGDWCWDANYLYICVSTNTWHRAAHASW